MIDDAFAQLSAATGLRFVNDGDTKEGPTDDRPIYQSGVYGDRWAPVLIAWATPEEVPDFGIDYVGEAQADRVRTPGGAYTYVSGRVYLDAAGLATMRSRMGEPTAEAVILHELGHLVGLAHVHDPHQIMTPATVRGGPTTYQAGDLAGLAILGTGPCQPAV